MRVFIYAQPTFIVAFHGRVYGYKSGRGVTDCAVEPVCLAESLSPSVTEDVSRFLLDSVDYSVSKRR